MQPAANPTLPVEPTPEVTRPAPRYTGALPPSLLARFSHEVRTQLTSLRYIGDYLISGADEHHPQWRSLELLRQNLDVLERLISDLFLVSEWEESNFALERTTLDFEKFIWGVAQEAREELARADIVLTVMLAGLGEAPMMADGRRLHWALLHIIRNAILYGRKTTVLELAARRDKAQVEIRIRDDGQGIAEAELPLIFDRFFRGEAATSAARRQDIRGLGQGLYFARALAEAHGGSLVASSEEGVGAEFLLRIPVIEVLETE